MPNPNYSHCRRAVQSRQCWHRPTYIIRDAGVITPCCQYHKQAPPGAQLFKVTFANIKFQMCQHCEVENSRRIILSVCYVSALALAWCGYCGNALDYGEVDKALGLSAVGEAQEVERVELPEQARMF